MDKVRCTGCYLCDSDDCYHFSAHDKTLDDCDMVYCRNIDMWVQCDDSEKIDRKKF